MSTLEHNFHECPTLFSEKTRTLLLEILPRAQLFKASLLNELLKGHFVNCFSGFNIQYSDIFC